MTMTLYKHWETGEEILTESELAGDWEVVERPAPKKAAKKAE